MPIHFSDLDVASGVAGLKSALIVPCNLCPAVTVSVRAKKPFLRLFRNPLKSLPFEGYLQALQARLRERGVQADVFKSTLYHHWFMCMWTSRKRRQLQESAKKYDAVIVLGCESATETARKAVESTGCRVIDAMKVTGIMNAELSFGLPADISFRNCTVVPIATVR